MIWKPIICWFRGHVWKANGVALSHPNTRSKTCQRCGKWKETHW